MKRIFSILALMVVFALVVFYVFMPPLNIHSFQFWFWLVVLLVALLLLLSANNLLVSISNLFRSKKKIQTQDFKIPVGGLAKFIIALICLIAIYIFGSAFIFSPVFMSGRYASRIEVNNVAFSEVPSYFFNKTAIIDRNSSEILGDKVMGEMVDLVSQFAVSDEYCQISYQGGTYRVTPLTYDGIIKYFKNRSQGIPGYIIVNTTTGETKLQRLAEEMKYVPSAYFMENLYRRLRFQHPFTIFGDPTFEIDESGNPYYVCTTYSYSGVFSLRRVTGVILFNPVDGTSQKYDLGEIPSWVDRVFPETLVIDELNDWGTYRNGFFNSIFSQQGVINTSEGYNYISKDDDIWLYTGMTSVVSDSSNVGFALVNLRTHEAQFIQTAGADEYAVMASAEGEVLNYGYTATFPVLINLNDEPFYILSLKDSAGLIKMYALVDAKDYQQVYTIKAEKGAEAAINELINSATNGTYIEGDLLQKTIKLRVIKEVIIEGNTNFYLTTSEDELYRVVLTTANAKDLLTLKEGDELNITYTEDEDEKLIQSLSGQ